MTEQNVDVAVLGGGPAGYVGAIRAAQLGFKVALIEGEALGGICLNWGCIPSKSLMHAAKILNQVRGASGLGIAGIDPAAIQPDWPAMLKKADANVAKLTGGVGQLLKRNGVEVIQGWGQVLDKQHIEVGDRSIAFHHLILATGTEYVLPDFARDDPSILTPKELFRLPELPKEVVIVGAGVVGVELATLLADLGAAVTLVEKQSTLMPYLDDDLRQAVERALKKRKVRLRTGQAVTGWQEGKILLADGAEIQTQTVIWATRRQARVDAIQPLIDAGLQLKNGYIVTDALSRTTLAHVYAAGDANGRFMLAHVAAREGQTAAEAIHGKATEILYDFMPYNLYGSPEIASVGLTERQAEAKGFIVKSGKFPFTANGKALIEGDTDGFVKVVYDVQYGEILGVHIAAPNATDLIGEAALLMQSEATVWDLAGTVHPHPTLSETLMEAAFKGLDRPVHML